MIDPNYSNFVQSDLPRIFHQDPAYFGLVADMPVEFRSPHTLHITILKGKVDRSFTYSVRQVANAVRGYVDIVSALAGEDFYTQWCLTFGTARMFEDTGTLLSKDEKIERLEVPAIVGDSWGFKEVKRGRGAMVYSDLENAMRQNLGAQLYRIERLLKGALQGKVEGNPTGQAQQILQGYLLEFKGSARGGNKRSSDVDYAYRRLSAGLGAERLCALNGAVSIRELARAMADQGRSLNIPRVRNDGWERQVPELATELEMLDVLITLCHRARRVRIFSELNVDHSSLEHTDDPVLRISASAADELMGFGSPEHHDRMPDLVALSRVAFHFDCDAADLYPTLGPVGLHLAAVCALGRKSRGVCGDDTDRELWGLRGLAEARYDPACFADLRDAREMARSMWQQDIKVGGQNIPPTLVLGDGFYNVPIVIKR